MIDNLYLNEWFRFDNLWSGIDHPWFLLNICYLLCTICDKVRFWDSVSWRSTIFDVRNDCKVYIYMSVWKNYLSLTSFFIVYFSKFSLYFVLGFLILLAMCQLYLAYCMSFNSKCLFCMVYLTRNSFAWIIHNSNVCDTLWLGLSNYIDHGLL